MAGAGLEGPRRAGYLVRCGGRRGDTGRCGNYVLLFADEKTVCHVCGAVHASWSDYSHSRTKYEQPLYPSESADSRQATDDRKGLRAERP